jgi:hypothetical protein
LGRHTAVHEEVTAGDERLGQFSYVVYLMRTGRMTALRSRRIHISVLVHVLCILFLAKAMVLLSW